jgi:hypothetical protein
MASKKTLISIDGGMSTGLIVGTYSDDTPFELTHAFQIEGGVEGFLEKVRVHHGEDWNMNLYGVMRVEHNRFYLYEDSERMLHDMSEDCDEECLCYETVTSEATVLAEKFTARGAAAGPFALKTSALEPLRIEGALLAMRVPVTWVSPAQQYFLPGKDKAEKKKRQHAWLRENGYAIMPKDLGTKDADDARSACAHVISWLRKFHKPTQDMFRKESR